MINLKSMPNGDAFLSRAFPGSQRVDISFRDAVKKYFDTVDFESTKHRSQAKWAANVYEIILEKYKNIENVPVSEIKRIKPAIRTELIKMFRFIKTGEALYLKTQEKDIPHKVALKISRLTLDHLEAMLPIADSGRFGSIKGMVRREIMETPEGQFAVIHGTNGMAKDKKERTAARNAIQSMLTKQKMDWSIFWSNTYSNFVIVRKDDLNKIKNGRKK